MLNALIHLCGLFELFLEPEAQFTRGEDIGVAQELKSPKRNPSALKTKVPENGPFIL